MPAVVRRIAMWSGPRNISTAMMRSWGNRPDTAVCDEPLYAHYLLHTTTVHPGAGTVGRSDGQVDIQVSDDGVGGADPALGSGLRGLSDRVAALDGRLELMSANGDGTTVRARIPCG